MASLMALAEDAPGRATPLVDTVDVKTHCLFDGTKPVGFFIGEIAPEVAPRVRIHTERDSFAAPELFEPRSLDFAFIDGNHQHPWPLLDALNVTPLVRPGCWILLHDIDHPAVAARLGHEGGPRRRAMALRRMARREDQGRQHRRGARARDERAARPRL